MNPHDPLKQWMQSHNPTPPSPPGEWEAIQARTRGHRPWHFDWRAITVSGALAAAVLFAVLRPEPVSMDDSPAEILLSAERYFEPQEPVGQEYLTLLQEL